MRMGWLAAGILGLGLVAGSGPVRGQGSGAEPGAQHGARFPEHLAAARVAEKSAGAEVVRREVELAVELAEADPEVGTWAELEELGELVQRAGDLPLAERAHRLRLARLLENRGPEDFEALRARESVARAVARQGRAREALPDFEFIAAARGRTLEEDDPVLQISLSNLALTLGYSGEFRRAAELWTRILASRERTQPPDAPGVLGARVSLAGALAQAGELERARDLLEAVLAVETRTLGPDDRDLQITRLNLAPVLHGLGDRLGSRALLEAVVASRERTLPPEHPDLALPRENLAIVLQSLGDLRGARAHFEAALESRERSQDPDHPDLARARNSLGLILYRMGEYEAARGLLERGIASLERTAPGHPWLANARQGLAGTLKGLGLPEEAQELRLEVLAEFERLLPEGHPFRLTAARSVAIGHKDLGELAKARELEESLLELHRLHRGPDDPALASILHNLAWTLIVEGALAAHGPGAGESAPGDDVQRIEELLAELARIELVQARGALAAGSTREAEERAGQQAGEATDFLLSAALGMGALEAGPERRAAAFSLSETPRAAGLTVAALSRAAAGAPDYADLSARLRAAGEELAALAQGGALGEDFHRARQAREEAERALAARARNLLGAEGDTFAVQPEDLAARLGPEQALVTYRAFRRQDVGIEPDAEDPAAAPRYREVVVWHLAAFVLRGGEAEPDRRLALVDLGPLHPIRDAVRAWRDGIGVDGGAALRAGGEPDELRGLGLAAGPAQDARELGAHLRRAVLDPLAEHLAERPHLILVLDDLLHLVPFDALPAAEGQELVGDALRIELRVSPWELLRDGPPPGPGTLLALGGAAFDASPRSPAEEDPGEPEPPDPRLAQGPAPGATLLRGGPFAAGFAPLAHTEREARLIAELLPPGLSTEPLVFTGARAGRAALVEHAPAARYLHVATHGWFAAEGFASWSALPADGDSVPSSPRMGVDEAVRGMSPLLLCGLALAGANLPPDPLGRVPGLVTAEELSTLDLAGCELAVLSACDTNLGELSRAGQGVASLQKALHMAGARSVITSLWKVPDEATAELMLDFYRRLWVEGKPKHQALWEAKQRLRNAVDERGEPLYSVRDWAAWVLTGEPE